MMASSPRVVFTTPLAISPLLRRISQIAECECLTSLSRLLMCLSGKSLSLAGLVDWSLVGVSSLGAAWLLYALMPLRINVQSFSEANRPLLRYVSSLLLAGLPHRCYFLVELVFLWHISTTSVTSARRISERSIAFGSKSKFLLILSLVCRGYRGLLLSRTP